MARNKREYRSKRPEQQGWLSSSRSTTRESRFGRRGEPRAAGSRLFGSRGTAGNAAKPRKAPKLKRHPGLTARSVSRHFDWGRFRIGFVATVFGLLWLSLWVRAYYIQVVQGPELAAMAARQHRTSEFVVGERGQIFDSKGRLLAKSVAIKSIFANPARVANPGQTAVALARILGLDAAELKGKLTSNSPHVWIARQIGDAPAAEVREADLPGISITTEYARQYPNRHLAGRLIGFVGVDDRGLEGLEAALDEHLAGKQSDFMVERDARGSKLYLDARGEVVDIRGKDVRLTLDATVQYTAEEALEKAVKANNAKWGACLVVRVADGNVLAWAEYPNFNPNSFQKYSSDQWRNRLAMDPIEPGSAIKPLLVAAAMQEGVVDADTIFYCEKGRMRLDGKTIRDISAKDWLPVNKILRFSSNIGAAKIAMELGAQTYYTYLGRLGFGQRIGLPLVSEGEGILRLPGTWEQLELATAGFGQGFSVTLPQLAKAYLCLANDGVLKPLRLISDPDLNRQGETRVFDTAIARRVLEMMEGVVDEGTGKRAAIEGVSVAGKTSTAQKASPKGGYSDKVVASFVGLFPAHKPEYLVLVSVDEPEPHHYGGVVAAPAFKEVALRTLAYMGQLPEVPETVVASAKARPEPVQAEGPVRFCTGAELRGKVDKTCVIPGEDVPDVRGLSIRRAMEIFAGKGVVPSLKGSGSVVARQEPSPGKPWPTGANQCTLWLQDNAERS